MVLRLSNYDALIVCQKLVRKNRNANRPLTFLSFKLNVPESIENRITAADFWPEEVTIKPFLVNRQPPQQTGPPLTNLNQQNNHMPIRSSPRTVTPRRLHSHTVTPRQLSAQQTVYPYPHNLSWPAFHPNQLTVPSVYQYMPQYSRMP
uniref:(northern house mosquito) hypothetical protein n=1 Tax=Culex pipiens TaxID=7175 RepID=A0A8D8CRF8_CULPI